MISPPTLVLKFISSNVLHGFIFTLGLRRVNKIVKDHHSLTQQHCSEAVEGLIQTPKQQHPKTSHGIVNCSVITEGPKTSATKMNTINWTLNQPTNWAWN